MIRTVASRIFTRTRFTSSVRQLTSTRWLGTTDDAPTAADLGALMQSFRENSDAAQAVFSSSSELTTGLRSTITIRDKFTLNADEPKGLGGTDTAPNPVEILLGALGSCQEITYKAYGQAMGIPITRVAVAVDGHIDLRGFLSVSDVRPGFHTITGTVTIESTATDEELAQLKAVVDGHCPVLDMLQSVPTTLELKRA
eukprot:m.258846 g.258846  ORF g.258846 m.258846 type:complete len:198 (-) comp37168_c0_seq1:138-731(-)